jgi:L-fuculose-phosphate aldolase
MGGNVVPGRPDNHRTMKQDLILAGRVLAAAGQDDFTRGHVSARVPDNDDLFFMKAHSTGLDEITTANILTVDLDGNVVAGAARRHSEVFIHSAIYQARVDVRCVVHTHPPYTVALSATGRALACSSQPAALFHRALGIYDESINLIRTPEMGAAVARALGSHRAVILKNHGIAAVGASIAEAVVTAIMLENAARIETIAQAAGGPAAQFSDDDIAQLKRDLSNPEQFAVNFDYLVRRLKRG